MSHRNTTFILIIAPFLVAITYIIAAPPLGKWNIHTSFAWSTLGMLLSYYGFVFSLFAVLEVRILSDRHYFKARSPELSKKLVEISRRINEFSTEPAFEIRSQPFVSEIPAILRSAGRIKNKEVRKIARVANKNFTKLMSGVRRGYGPTIKASQADAYWEVHQSLSELADEISNQIKDMKAV